MIEWFEQEPCGASDSDFWEFWENFVAQEAPSTWEMWCDDDGTFCVPLLVEIHCNCGLSGCSTVTEVEDCFV